ncbi:MAG: transporter substrate-binding protein [Acidimicrobiaceae bacterium]|nr:transporter substrate-binding protein [Acidimicrobiaceae bacterium]
MVGSLSRKGLGTKAAALVGAGLLLSSVGMTNAFASKSHAVHSVKSPRTASFVPPKLKGTDMSFIMDGTATTSNEIEIHAINLLAKWGAKVSIHWAPSTSIEYADMLHGGTIMEGGLSVGLAAYNSGIPVEAIALPEPRQDYVLLGRPNISSLADLKGKTLGILDMVGENGVDALIALKAAGLKQSQVNILNVGGQSTRLAALVAGRIDATMLSHASEFALAGQGFHVLYDYMTQNKDLYDGLWFARSTWAKSHQTAAVALNEADLLSFVYFNNKANNAGLVKETASYDSGINTSQTASLFNQLRSIGAYPDGSILSASPLKLQEIYYNKVGALTAQPAVAGWSDLSYGKKALADLGAAAR